MPSSINYLIIMIVIFLSHLTYGSSLLKEEEDSHAKHSANFSSKHWTSVEKRNLKVTKVKSFPQKEVPFDNDQFSLRDLKAELLSSKDIKNPSSFLSKVSFIEEVLMKRILKDFAPAKQEAVITRVKDLCLRLYTPVIQIILIDKVTSSFDRESKEKVRKTVEIVILSVVTFFFLEGCNTRKNILTVTTNCFVILIPELLPSLTLKELSTLVTLAIINRIGETSLFTSSDFK